jgi:hypothetical protein
MSKSFGFPFLFHELSLEFCSNRQTHDGPATRQSHPDEQVANATTKHVTCTHPQREQSNQETCYAASSSSTVLEPEFIATSNEQHFGASNTTAIENAAFGDNDTVSAADQREGSRVEAGADDHG